MTTRTRIALLIYGMVDAVLFGAGAVAVLVLAGPELWKYLLPAVVVAAFALAAPLSWAIAPRLRARNWGKREMAPPHSSAI